MYTYIIVDDEPLIRRGILKKLEDFPDIACISQASNGQTALELIKEEDPDFIITDMKMPIMDGCEFLSVLSSQYPDKNTIVISGYKDFEYAQHALRANTVDYIVKPFSKEQLWGAVERVISKLDSKASLEQKLTVNETEKELLKYEYDKQLLKNLLFDSHGSNFAQFSSKKLKSLKEDSCYFLITIVLHKAMSTDDLSRFLSVRGMASSCVPLNHDNIDNIIFLLCFHSPDKQKKYIQKASDLIKLLNMFFESCLEQPFYGISQVHSALAGMHDTFVEAADALNQMTISPTCNYIFYTSQQENPASLEWEDLEYFLFLVESGQTAQIRAIFAGLFHYIARLEYCRLKDVKDYCLEIVETLRKSLPKDITVHKSAAASLSLLNNLNFLFSFPALEQYFLQIFMNLANAFESSGLYKEKDIIDNIKNYICLHHEKNLTLEFVSSLFHLNRTYLSSAFKNHTSISFVDYVNQVRIEEAKKLLVNTNKKTYQVAQLVGYENVKYFFRIFKKMEGVTPEQYRSR